MQTGSVADRLYYTDPALEFTAVVTDIRLESSTNGEQVWQIALDRTAFYPEGGGQPCDTGLLIATAKSGAVLEVPVERVSEDPSGEVWHTVRKPLPQGTEIIGRVDPDRRLDHTQQHSGQHLLSAVFLAELGARTVSFHLGVDNVTIDLAGPASLTEADLHEVSTAANRLIFENRPVRPSWVSREDAETMLARGDLRKLPDRDGPIRLVEISGIEFNACGGTHVATTGAVGGIALRRVQKVKQGLRVEFCCGLRAIRSAREDYLRLTEVAATLSAAPADVITRVQNLIEDKKAAAKALKNTQNDTQTGIKRPKHPLKTPASD